MSNRQLTDLDCFQVWQTIPKDNLYEKYKTVIPYGNIYRYLFNRDLLKEIRKLNKHDTVDNPKLQNLLGADGFLTVYYGSTERDSDSSNYWTLDLKSAHKRGMTYVDSCGLSEYYVTTGKVQIDKLITYVPNSEGAEIVVLNRSIKQRNKELFKCYDDNDE